MARTKRRIEQEDIRNAAERRRAGYRRLREEDQNTEDSPNFVSKKSNSKEVIHEDDPRWNWQTMGNKMRGIQDDRGNWYHQHADGRITNTHPRSPNAPDWREPARRRNDRNSSGGPNQSAARAIREDEKKRKKR